MLDDILLVEYEEEILLAVSENSMSIAKRMLAKGMSVEDVADTTRLSISKVEKLQLQLVPA